MLDYHKTKNWKFQDVKQHYDARDTIIYALGLGYGADPLDPAQLQYVYEKNLVAVPTLACVLASPGFWMKENSELGIDWVKIVHGEQSLAIHRPLPPAATVIGRSSVTHVVDKQTGAIVYTQRQLFEEKTGELLATVEQGVFCRGDGGFSKTSGESDEAPPPRPAPPQDTPPSHVIALNTRQDAALLYRLSGDTNPLHADPEVAGRAGYPRPILHGLATYGMACRGLLNLFGANDPSRLKSLSARMSSPVFPGETISIECWETADGISFQARVVERDVVVLKNGHAIIDTP